MSDFSPYGEGQDGGALKFAHPAALGESEWAHLLDNFYPRTETASRARRTRSAPRPAFDEDGKRYCQAPR